jgi:AcrR family transcriptional regulator
MTLAAGARLGRPPAHQNVPERIVQQAAVLFARKGYELASMGELAAALGVSKAGIYHYFPTKQHIYDAIIVGVLEGLVRQVGPAVQAHRHAPEKLRAFMTEHAAYFEANYHGFVVMLVGFSGISAPEMKQEATRLRDEHEGMLRAIIDQGLADGVFVSSSPATVGRAVLSMLNWMVRWFKPGAGQTATDVALSYYDLIIGGLMPAAHRPHQSPAP